MELSAFILFTAGILTEIYSLWEANHTARTVQSAHNIISSPLPPGRWILAGLAILVLFAEAITYLTAYQNHYTTLSDSPVFIIFTLLGLFVFFAGVLGNRLLPQVNEKSIAIVLSLSSLSLFTGQTILPSSLAWALGVISLLLTAFLVINRRRLGPVLKALVYLCYLLSLMLLVFQPQNLAFFQQRSFNFIDAFVFGTVFVFMILHGLFAIRFFLITSSLLIPRNRIYLPPLISCLYTDEQVDPIRFWLFFAVITTIVFFNRRFLIFPPQILESFIALLSVQFFFNDRSPFNKTI